MSRAPETAPLKPAERSAECRKAADEAELGSALYAADQTNDDLALARNKALAFLNQAVREVRECGRYVFDKQPKVLVDYRDAYAAMKNRKARKAAKERQAAAAADPADAEP